MDGGLRDGRYALLARLGEGTQGTTWDAVDKREGRPVAIKQFDVRGARAWKDVELAEREARVLASLSHPRLPKYVEHFEENGSLYLVMEKIEGVPLSTIRKQGGLSERDVVRLLRDASEVLEYLHGRAAPVVHRDLKPSNVLQRPDGSFAFVDFGAVRDRMRPEGGSTVVGTFGYMAPEQFQGRAGPGSDVYAVGATAIALLTGEEPEKLPHRGLAIDVEAALAGRASRPLREALTRMLDPNPDTRATRIAPLLAGLEGEAPRASRASRSSYEPREEWGRVRDLGRELGREIRDHVEREIEGQIAIAAARGDAHAKRWMKHADKRARKRADRAERRQARREHRRAYREHHAPPWAVMLLIVLGLTIARLVVGIALGIVVPAVLTILSLFFGKALRDSAQRVSAAGERAREAIGRAREAVQRGDFGENESAGDRMRVEAEVHEDARVRVSEARATSETREAREAKEAAHDEDAHDEDEGHRPSMRAPR